MKKKIHATEELLAEMEALQIYGGMSTLSPDGIIIQDNCNCTQSDCLCSKTKCESFGWCTQTNCTCTKFKCGCEGTQYGITCKP